MDITPMIPAGRQVIESYGGGRFRVSGKLIEGSVIVFPTRTILWPVATPEAIDADTLEPVFGEAGLELLLIGCGNRAFTLPIVLRQALRARGIASDTMGTGAAARTYNVLMAEDRRVAAALIAIA